MSTMLVKYKSAHWKGKINYYFCGPLDAPDWDHCRTKDRSRAYIFEDGLGDLKHNKGAWVEIKIE